MLLAVPRKQKEALSRKVDELKLSAIILLTVFSSQVGRIMIRH